MKFLKIAGVFVLVIIALPFIIAVFVPKSYTVSVSETINKSHQVVYDYVRFLDNQRFYSVWVMQDPNLNPEIIGTDGTVGVVQKWDSKLDDVGAGEQTITSLTPDKMEVDVRFIRPFEGNAKAITFFEVVNENQTKLSTEFLIKDKYPLNLPSYLFGKKMIEKAQIQNLQNIKRILEAK